MEHEEGEQKHARGVSWKELDVKRFLFFGTAVYMAEYALLYPLDLVRTKLQACPLSCRGICLTTLMHHGNR